jgi:hypothetical protein
MDKVSAKEIKKEKDDKQTKKINGFGDYNNKTIIKIAKQSIKTQFIATWT